MLTDALFWAPTVRVADAHARTNNTWMYRFDFAPTALRWLGLGAMHSMELSNIFGDPGASRVSALTRMGDSSLMDDMTELMQSQWASFIHTGKPNEDWPVYASPQRNTMIFDSEPRVVEAPFERRRQAWENYNMLEWGSGRPELLSALGFITEALENR